MSLLRKYEEIEFYDDYQILFKFFISQTGSGYQIISQLRKQNSTLNDEELVHLIKERLTDSHPVNYLESLLLWSNNFEYWKYLSNMWQHFYNFHYLYQQINK